MQQPDGARSLKRSSTATQKKLENWGRSLRTSKSFAFVKHRRLQPKKKRSSILFGCERVDMPIIVQQRAHLMALSPSLNKTSWKRVFSTIGIEPFYTKGNLVLLRASGDVSLVVNTLPGGMLEVWPLGATSLHKTSKRPHMDLLPYNNSLSESFEAAVRNHQIRNKLGMADTLLCTLERRKGLSVPHIAAALGSAATLQSLLISNKPAILLKSADGATCAHEAARFGRIEAVATLLAYKDGLFRILNAAGQTPLHTAAIFGKEKVVKLLSAAVPSTCSATDKHGRVPLHYAARDGLVGAVKSILEVMPAACQLSDQAGNLPVHLAAGRKHIECVKLLMACSLRLSGTSNAKFEGTVLQVNKQGKNVAHIFCENGAIDGVKYLLIKCPSAFSVRRPLDLGGSTALWAPVHDAAFNGHTQVVLCILASNAEIAALRTEPEMHTCSHLAAVAGHSKVLEVIGHSEPLLLQQLNSREQTSVHLAAGSGHLECLKVLHRLCPELFDVGDQNGNLAMHIVLMTEDMKPSIRQQTVQLLVSLCSRSLEHRNLDGNTCLHMAVLHNRFSELRLLTEACPTLFSLRNNANKVPRQLAQERMAHRLVQQLSALQRRDRGLSRSPAGRCRPLRIRQRDLYRQLAGYEAGDEASLPPELRPMADALSAALQGSHYAGQTKRVVAEDSPPRIRESRARGPLGKTVLVDDDEDDVTVEFDAVATRAAPSRPRVRATAAEPPKPKVVAPPFRVGDAPDVISSFPCQDSAVKH